MKSFNLIKFSKTSTCAISCLASSLPLAPWYLQSWTAIVYACIFQPNHLGSQPDSCPPPPPCCRCLLLNASSPLLVRALSSHVSRVSVLLVLTVGAISLRERKGRAKNTFHTPARPLVRRRPRFVRKGETKYPTHSMLDVQEAESRVE